MASEMQSSEYLIISFKSFNPGVLELTHYSNEITKLYEKYIFQILCQNQNGLPTWCQCPEPVGGDLVPNVHD